ncbi:methyltransferase [Accumulibacter sp.]|uniref:methyltransferase n=1 Tax=Accumulibacter sp. TaxID=2053492 RepID=UPI0025F6E6AF|nr:methyltransferase [Accumulibacter sp.]MCM8612185.1 methyltransferase domain-containing protein [Accumulibacter sp.]MCM8635858.1 methyltransferase domain-containing protein [Accumulibacter sp.]MCM8639533.1 methyltransferase domain-containing protein [Accumulibacter sp.]
MAEMTSRPSPDVVADIKARLAASDWQGAAEVAEASLASFPSNPFLLSAAHKAAAQLGDLGKARDYIDRAVVAAPEVAAYHSLSGRLHQKAGDHEAALACYRRTATLAPEVASHHAAVGALLYTQQRYGEAIASYQAALRLDSSQAGWWNRLARSATLAGDLPLAVEAYASSLEVKEDYAVLAASMEVERQLAAGSNPAGEASAAYYNAIFAGSAKYARHGSLSEYVGVWREIVALLVGANCRRVLDLGCGPGQFAEFLRDQHTPIEYVGIDFSETAVENARARCPEYRFEVCTLPSEAAMTRLPCDAVVCTEVLEHIEQDREVLRSVPGEVLVIATVPNFDSFGHVRHFLTADEVSARYGDLLSDLQVVPVAISATSTIWLLSGRRTRETAQRTGAGEGAGVQQASDDEMAACAVVPSTGSSFQSVDAHEAVLWTDGTRYVEEFLATFGLPFSTAVESLSAKAPCVVLRHDVDWSIENALAMATLEYQLGVRATYFLLHPDGQFSPSNYFGEIADGRLQIRRELFDHAKRLIDLGHEIGLHNDLITLSLNIQRHPGELLEQILGAFQRNGIAVKGTVAHGSRRCRADGYLNYQIFREFRGKLFEEYLDAPDHSRFLAEHVSCNGYGWDKFSLSMADHGLLYEANFLPHGLYVSDSSARWFFLQNGATSYLDKFSPKEQFLSQLQQRVLSTDAGSNIQSLVHPCHWSTLSNHNPHALRAARAQRDLGYGTRLMATQACRLERRANVLYAKASPRFAAYEKRYAAAPQVFSIAPTVASFIGEEVSRRAAAISAVLELGCGQGDFLEFVRALLVRGAPDRAVSCIGVDGSVEAIRACAERYASCLWVADSIEGFMARRGGDDAATASLPQSYDLILDKTGTVCISDCASAQATLAAIHAALAVGGSYVYVASRHYYDLDLKERVYRSWNDDWLGLAERVFGPPTVFDDSGDDGKGYYKRVYSKRPFPAEG